uniref:Uncharacterized protein n=1 Tax=Lutzomyia longipalpis TaxID=7200 RepID=A0A3F2ZDD1_LUTLO
MAVNVGNVSKNPEKSFKVDFFHLKVKIFLILKIISCDFHTLQGYPFKRKLIFPTIALMIFISCGLNLPSALADDKTAAGKATCLIIFAAGFQIVFKVLAICLYAKDIRCLICWFGEVEENAFWTSLGVPVDRHLRTTLHYLKLTIKFVALTFFVTGNLMAFKYFWTDILIFYVPFLSRGCKFLCQYFILFAMAVFVFIAETSLLVLGFFFVGIINIFFDAIEKLDEIKFIESSKKVPMRTYHKKHVEILKKLKDLENIFSGIQTAQLASSLPMAIGTFYLLRLYPNEIIYYTMIFTILG